MYSRSSLDINAHRFLIYCSVSISAESVWQFEAVKLWVGWKSDRQVRVVCLESIIYESIFVFVSSKEDFQFPKFMKNVTERCPKCIPRKKSCTFCFGKNLLNLRLSLCMCFKPKFNKIQRSCQEISQKQLLSFSRKNIIIIFHETDFQSTKKFRFSRKVFYFLERDVISSFFGSRCT